MAIPTPIIRNLNENGILRTMAIDLSESTEDRAAIIEVLRSKLYSDKVLAPIREYSTNGMDSHVEAGYSSTPLQVFLPTPIAPEFRVRDFGIGLNPDEVEGIYIKYGRSTKRSTNSQTGQLGLGCKSAFAYGDNFIIVSYKDGVKTTYNLTISGVCSVMSAEPMVDGEKNGIEVIVPVNQEDVREFQDKAVSFFKYWKICPDIIGGDAPKLESLRNELAIKPLFSAKDWEIRPDQNRGYYDEGSGTAVMGNVPYPINWNIISTKLNLGGNEKQQTLFDFVRRNKTILRFNIGDLDFSASRESLEYTEKTCKAVISLVESILGDIFNILNGKIQSAASYWDALLIYNQIFGRDGEKLFHGDVHRLEGYFKGKFSYKGLAIASGQFEKLDNWDSVLGYSETGQWFSDVAKKISVRNMNPVLTTFFTKNSRLKQNSPTEYNFNTISVRSDVKIVIHDLDKPILTKVIARWCFRSESGHTTPVKVYMLRFKDTAQKTEFFKKMNFDSAPVILVSDIIDSVKAWMKASRSNYGVSAGTRDPQTVRFTTVANRYNSAYECYNTVSWDRDEIDLKEEEGYFVPMESGQACVNNHQVCLNQLSHNAWVLLTKLGETPDKIYGILDKNRNSKWFEKAIEDEQWVNLESYLKKNEDAIIHSESDDLGKSIKFFQTCSSSTMHLGINFCEQILPLLKNKNGDMYKACVEVTSILRNSAELNSALNFFGMGKSVSLKCDTDYKKLFESVYSTYSMLNQIDCIGYVQSNDKRQTFSKDLLNTIAEYINIVDSSVGVPPNNVE